MASFRSFLYRLARLMGDVRAVQKGPVAITKRMERRVLGRMASRVIRKIVR